MPDYRSQFVDNQRGNAGQPASATATADLAGSQAVSGVQHLPTLALTPAHARARAAHLVAEQRRYANDPPPGVYGSPEQHRAYLSMEAMKAGYNRSVDKIEQGNRDYQLATQPTFSGTPITRDHAIGGSLASRGRARAGARFFHTLSRQRPHMMTETPGLMAAALVRRPAPASWSRARISAPRPSCTALSSRRTSSASCAASNRRRPLSRRRSRRGSPG